jgi:hypothetical protein
MFIKRGGAAMLLSGKAIFVAKFYGFFFINTWFALDVTLQLFQFV